MDKKKDIWIILAVITAIIYTRINSQNKIVIPLILLGLCIIVLVFVIIWRIKQNINLKKYGPEEIVKIQRIAVNEKNIDKYAKILSNGKTDNCDEEILIKEFTTRISIETKIQELLSNVNELLGKIGYDLYIEEDDVLKADYEFIKIRRANGYSTLRHDINVIINILNSHNLEAINIEKNNNGDINLGIIPFDKLEELNELGEYDEDIEEQY